MVFTANEVLFAFSLTLIAGLSTGVGSALAFFTKQTNKKFLSVVLGFSAGVMIYVSLVEIFAEARISLEGIYGAQKGYLYTTIAFFIGVFVIAIIDNEARDVSEIENKDNEESELMRMGLFSALAIAIHNFPEGIATFVAALQNPTLGISIAIAIAIHNIPEGIAVSVPVYFATNSKKKAFKLSFISGLSEPAGAILGYLILIPFLNGAMFGIIFAGVAGIMVYIALDELLPTAHKYGHNHEAIYGLVLGMMVMASSLILFA